MEPIFIVYATLCVLAYSPSWPLAVAVIAFMAFLAVREFFDRKASLEVDAIQNDLLEIKRQLEVVRNVQSLKNGFGK